MRVIIAKLLQPDFSNNFIASNMFDLKSWENPAGRYLVAILMVGRLLDIDKERSHKFINELKKLSDNIVA